MNTHFDWTISHLKKYATHDGHDDIVYEVGYVVTGINTTGIALTQYQYSGQLQLNTNNVTDPIAYSNITKDDVVSWVKAVNPNVEQVVINHLNTTDHLRIETMPWE